jgi:SpoU rRNA methylase family enzyme
LKPEIIPVLHNVRSVQRVVDMARVAYALDYDKLVVTKAYGGAAQSGVPEAMRLALREGRSLIVLPDLSDAVELLKPDRILIVSRDYAEEYISPARIPKLEGRVMIAFSGSDPDFTIEEVKLGTPVYIEKALGRLGPVAEASIILYLLGRGE